MHNALSAFAARMAAPFSPSLRVAARRAAGLCALAFVLAAGRAHAQGVLAPTGSTVDSSLAAMKDSTRNNLPDSTAQLPPDPSLVKSYRIAGITVSGTRFLDQNVLVIISGLRVGDKLDIPGEGLSKAIANLWRQGLFGDVKIYATRFDGQDVYLQLYLQEKPRLTRSEFNRDLKKNERDALKEKLKLQKGRVVTPTLKQNITTTIRNYYTDKGYWDAATTITEKPDTGNANGVVLAINIKRNKRVKIQYINVEGSKALTARQIRRKMKDTKQRSILSILKGSKYIEKKYTEDKERVVKAYQALGYRDAKIASDTVAKLRPGRLGITLKMDEGNRYYFRFITWVGNTLHTDQELNTILGIKRGDVYNQATLDSRLYIDPNGRDISSLYLDDGYLFFTVTPSEKNVDGDSIDLEIRLYEGQQATVNRVTVVGNTKTSDKVILREVRTRPGQKFSRADIIRTQRELQQLGYFDPEQMGVNPKPNPTDGTVDIEYKVAERSSDQIELSGGWGAGRVVGSLGLTLNNFSARKAIKPKAWRPVPSGDGQRLSLRAQSTGVAFQSYNASFTEPWLGGRRPNAFTVSGYYSVQNYSSLTSTNQTIRQYISVLGTSVSLGRRLKWPDDYFTIQHSLNYQRYNVENYALLKNGQYNNFYFKETFSRNSIDQPIFPRSGAMFSLSVQFTPPYSALSNKDYTKLDAAQKYKFTEYHKWRFDASWYTKLVGNLVLNTRLNMGFMGEYTGKTGLAPFGRFYVGGDGLTGFQLDDRELIGLRGYQNNSLTPRQQGVQVGGAAFDKFVLELRYPLTLNPKPPFGCKPLPRLAMPS